MFDWWHREITLHKWMKLIDIIGWPNKMKAHTSHDLQLKAVNTSMDCLLDGKLRHFPRNEDRFQSNSEGIQDEAIVKALQCSLPQSNKSCKIAIVVSSHWVSNRHTVTASKYQGWMQNKLGWRFRIVHSGVRRGYFGSKASPWMAGIIFLRALALASIWNQRLIFILGPIEEICGGFIMLFCSWKLSLCQ